MAAAKTMTGARAKLLIGGSTSADPPRVVGIFNNVSYGLQYDAQPVYILGRYSAAEIEYTGQEPVGITASGWRIVNHGPHTDARVPKLSDLLRHEYLSLTIVDRQTGQRIATIHSVRPTGFTTALSERQLQNMQLSFMGILVDDEDTTNVEESTATDLP